MEQNVRESWGSRIGFLMAAAGSAIGLGNIWRFPYVAGDNGGGAFLIIYLGCVFLIMLNVMMAELALGRKSQISAVGAYKRVSRRWTFVGVMGVLSGFLIMGFYPVVGGWATAYIFKSFTGLLVDPAAIAGHFEVFIENPVEPLLWMLLFLVVNVLIVVKGIKAGIEVAGKILMPLLFVLLIVISIKSMTLEGAGAGLSFLFKPDWDAVSGQTFLAAIGQAFFSLSLGMGCMVTYGSYLNKGDRLPQNAFMIVTMDTIVAILAGLALFPALFAFGMKPTEGPGLVFSVAPAIFAAMGNIGIVLSGLFFVALAIAALTSSVSLLEVVVAYMIDERGLKRKTAVVFSASIMGIMCIASSLSLGIWSHVKVLGVGAFDMFDFLTDKVFLAIGGFFTAIMVGWFMDKKALKEELNNQGETPFKLFEGWYFLIKYVIPFAIGAVAITGIRSVEETGVVVLGMGIIALLAFISKKL